MAIKLEFLGVLVFRLEYQKISEDLAESENFLSVQGQNVDKIVRQKDEEIKVSTFYTLPG